MSGDELALVGQYGNILERALQHANASKPAGQIDPPLTAHDIAECIKEIVELSERVKTQAFASIETATREKFYKILASTTIGDPKFGAIWNLFDVVSSLSDRSLCEASLMFWLVEELLDSQTIDGCRTVFDYLESRRDALTAKNFKPKNLVILRSFNELLRRLSRAEDTVFCGRVFNFLFQSFPLGDKSSVNLRGEYHVENVTTFEEQPSLDSRISDDGMDVDVPESVKIQDLEASTSIEEPKQTATQKDGQNQGAAPGETPMDQAGKAQSAEQPTSNQLYSTFWSLQEIYSHPTSLFVETKLATFKIGLEATMRAFNAIQQDRTLRSSKTTEEETRTLKRKRSNEGDELSDAFNPKYLTSRDLFDLELRDLSFRRHILVQALILLDFLLSLTVKAKQKLENLSNRSVLYSYTLSEDNAKWASGIRHDVANYLSEGPEGKFFYRMVATVLSRDKNWTHWKAASCPPITKSAVSAEEFKNALRGAHRTFAEKKQRSAAMGSLNLKFLLHTGGDEGMESLQNPGRYEISTLESFERPLADDDFDLEMATSDEDRHIAEDKKSSNLWRALRIVAGTNIGLLDKVDDGKNVRVLFEVPAAQEGNDDQMINGEAPKEGTASADGVPNEVDQVDSSEAVEKGDSPVGDQKAVVPEIDGQDAMRESDGMISAEPGESGASAQA